MITDTPKAATSREEMIKGNAAAWVAKTLGKPFQRFNHKLETWVDSNEVDDLYIYHCRPRPELGPIEITKVNVHIENSVNKWVICVDSDRFQAVIGIPIGSNILKLPSLLRGDADNIEKAFSKYASYI